MLNKNADSLKSELKEQTEKGKKIYRYLDAQVKIVKKDDNIRKAINASLGW